MSSGTPRLPFDPSRMSGPSVTPSTNQPAATSKPAAMSVTQLATVIDRALRDHTPSPVRVVGEIGQFRERSHWYFDIKDTGAVVSCVMWQSAARKAGFVPASGQQVVLTGRVEFYPQQGRTQLIAEKLEPVGAGALDLALRKLIEEARALGWLDDSRKRPLPMFPRRVAVVTSRSGAALQDVLDTARRRCACMDIAVYDVRVQGDGAAEQVASAVRVIGQHHRALGVDVVLVTRGGGSMEDLWAFNDRAVAEAIVNCPIPVVAAIGHETDTTLAELVADVRGATPTQAIMRIAPDAAALHEQLRSMGQRLLSLTQRIVQAEDQRLTSMVRHARLAWRGALSEKHRTLDALAIRAERCKPAAVFAQRRARLDVLAARLTGAMEHRAGVDLVALAARLSSAVRADLQSRVVSVEASARNLDLVGPLSVLKRGYSVTLASDGSVIGSAKAVVAGQVVRTRLADGSFTSVVQGEEGAQADLAPLRQIAPAGRRAVKKATKKPDETPGLFA